MQRHFKSLTHNMIDSFSLSKTDFIVEIGNNDGGMVKYFSDLGYSNHLGVDPSKNVCDFAKSIGVNVKNEFFNLETAHEIKSDHGDVKAFFAANTLAHIPDITSVFEGIDYLLSKDGVFITEDPYLLDLLRKTSYDQIYDEHIYMFSCNSVKKIFKLFDLHLTNAIPQITHGGSMRYVISRNKSNMKNLNKILDYEKKMNSIQDFFFFLFIFFFFFFFFLKFFFWKFFF
jgi:methylation protein EvaC